MYFQNLNKNHPQLRAQKLPSQNSIIIIIT